jgi:hypothetical protein
MKITRKQLEENIRKFLNEAAPDGYIQKKYRNSFKRMIATASRGGTKSSPPYTKKAKMGRSGTVGNP